MPRKIIRRRPSVTDIAPPEPAVEPMERAKRPSMLIPIVFVIAVACIGYGCWKFLPLSSKGATKAEASSGAEQAADIAKQVAKHVLVKTDESPLIATVQDPDALRAQNPVFYKDAQSGDKLLIWSDKAVLYSTSKDVVLAMLSMSAFNAASSTKTAAPVVNETSGIPKDQVKIEVRNGSATPGLARKAGDALKADGWKIVTIADAKVKPVAKTEIYVSSNKSLGNLPSSLVSMLKGSQISSLGQEPTTSADILVIVGSDYQP